MKTFKWSLFTLVVILDALSTVIICRAIYVRHGEIFGMDRMPANSVQPRIVDSKIGDLAMIEADDRTLPDQSSSTPARLIIPKIRIDADLDRVALMQNGEIAVPDSPIKPAWFESGPRPGEIGNAIIVGHSGWSGQIPAIFDSLNKIQIGDRVYVLNKDKKISIYVVKRIRSYRESEDPREVFDHGDGKAHLNLITCSGVWNKITQNYSTRLVVFADKEI